MSDTVPETPTPKHPPGAILPWSAIMAHNPCGDEARVVSLLPDGIPLTHTTADALVASNVDVAWVANRVLDRAGREAFYDADEAAERTYHADADRVILETPHNASGVDCPGCAALDPLQIEWRKTRLRLLVDALLTYGWV